MTMANTTYYVDKSNWGFKVVGITNGQVNFPTESKLTKDEAKAIEWKQKAEIGEFPAEAGWGSYSDD